ncbi:SH3 domain-containing protein [Clostridium perfringens]|uniref:SH3 domain-containing protein n=3 Tax=Clostridium perfringens TaxID=1502 RepID=UPI0018976508|nr:SH3 domain-containing protein [Clostridium perfringens]ELC8390882.1 SH3 domain-containing protein [Clostridium perfringens]MBI6006983.1 SH3 domain-containing protein [Clostridium perfringens]MBI6010358.1 SH3 domain-containing protein [Clostridium perfringens]MBI6019011.1 SH3 domain-containing protein [Clostridium perfringens]MDK0529634.1 SH3 domain-containing protein [Clostridium perfringens]
MNRRKISALLLSCTLAMNISSFNEIVLADENKGEEVQKESHKESNCIAGDYHEVNNGNAKNTENTPVINGIKVNKQLIDINYSQGVTINPKYIVIHDTDNRQAGANAMANRNYFANHPNAKASAHYIIDEGNIIQALEDTWKGWHVGDGNNPNINNSTTIAIELCVNKGNDFDKTLENGVELTKYLMNKYNIPAENVVMHRDASGKTCSRMMIEDRPSLWPYFKERISGGDGSLEDDGLRPKMQGKVTNASVLNVRESPSTSGRIVHKLNRNQVVGIYEELNGWYKIDYIDGVKKKYGYVSKDYISIINENPEDEETNGDIEIEKPSVSLNKQGVVKVNSALNMRSGPGSNYGVIGTLCNNDEVEIIKEVDGWYEIKFNGKSGYVSSQYIKVVDNESNEEKPSVSLNKQGVVKVNSALNMRSGPGSNYGVIGTLRNNDKVEIIKEVDGWYEIKFNGKVGYASKSYITIVNEGSNNGTESEIKEGTVYGVSTNLNVRTGPGTSYQVIGYLLSGDKVKILGEENGWYKVQFNASTGTKNGYVSKDYIKV